MIVDPSRMGRLNKRALLGHLHRVGTASRADLAKALGLSQPTAGKIVDELLDLGVFEEISTLVARANHSHKHSRVGRPARMLRLSRAKSRFLGIELGIRETSVAVLPVGVNREDDWTIRVQTPDSAKEWVRQLRTAADQILEKDFWGVLVSVPGMVDESRGKVHFSPNLHWTEKADLSGLIRQVWKAPVVFVQEERALALGHQAIDPSAEDFLLVDFGDGVGGAVIIAGKLFTRQLPVSGELGHTPIIGNERRCGCGATGCLETLTSVPGLLQVFAAASPEAPNTWAAFAQAIAAQGLPPWLAQVLDATAGVIAGALNVIGLRRVVITGALNELPTVVHSHLATAIKQGTLWSRFGEVKVESAPRHRIAGLVAAGLDRLIVPMAEPERHHEALLYLTALHS